ncbi:MAG: hypothetical protein LBH25_01380 [Fibromonadaceae bacterium]|jgi:hypothetical protein|nr:hypothetical protein [Fibromonadaceae bacterium]
MKKTTKTLALALAAALAFHANAFATAQEPDLLIHNGEKYDLTVNPMEPFFKENPEKRPPSPNTALWRGYIATFEIRIISPSARQNS